MRMNKQRWIAAIESLAIIIFLIWLEIGIMGFILYGIGFVLIRWFMSVRPPVKINDPIDKLEA